jgi:hypothetical protein
MIRLTARRPSAATDAIALLGTAVDPAKVRRQDSSRSPDRSTATAER